MLRQLAYPLLVIILPFVMYVQLWHGEPAERQWVLGDAGDSYWPDLAAIELAFSQGEFPLWNPYERAGIPFAADPQPGVLYPLNWLLALYGYFAGGVSFGLLQFKLLLHFSIAGFGLYLFLRDRALPRAAAAVGAFAYEFGGWFPFNIWGSLSWPLAWTPYLLLAIDRVMRDPRRGTGIQLAAFAALTVNAGSPPAMYYGCMIAVPYFVYRLVQSRGRRRFSEWARALAPTLLAAGALAGIFSAPTLLAGMKLSKETNLAAPPFSHAASGSLSVDELLVFLLPSGSAMYLYMGAATLLLAAFALHHRNRGEVAFFGAVTLLGVFLTLGASTLVFRVFYELVPGFSLFRLAYRYASLTSFGLSALAAYGTASVIERLVPENALRVTGTAVGAIALLALWLRITREPVRSPALTQELFVAALLLGVTWAIVYALRRSEHAGLFSACLVCVVLLDFSANIPKAPNLRPGTRDRPQYISGAQLAKLRKDARGYRIYNEFALDDRAGSKLQLRDFRGYMDPLTLRRYSLLIREQLRAHPVELLRLFNVRFLTYSVHGDNGMSHHYVPNPSAVSALKPHSPNIFELPDPAPNAYWTDRVQVLHNDDQVRHTLYQLDYHQGAMLAGEDLTREQLTWARSLPGKRPVVAARVVSRNYNQVSFQVDAPAEGLLLINETWFPGWRAEVDGVDVPLMRANSLMEGVRVTKGAHRVVIRFRPMSYIVLAWLAIITMFALLGWQAWELLRGSLGSGRLRPLATDAQQ